MSAVPFPEHVQLLRLFLTHREAIVESIESLLNAQRKPVPWLQDGPLLTRHFEDCFFALTAPQARLRGQLEAAHGAAGFRPRQVHHLHNDLIHPAEMMIRAFHFWQQTRWPGRNGRLHFAHTLFNLYILRSLQFLSLRLWDEDPSTAGARLAQIQALLDALWQSSPAGQPILVRDARWLLPLAQSLITDELAPCLHVASQVPDTLPAADSLEIQKAHVRMLGGHLTSQLRYYCTKDDLSIDDPSVVVRSRTSNALDFALLVQGLVALLEAFDRAVQSGDEPLRLEMAGAIFQGLSADPELFLNRAAMLIAYSMIEHVFIAANSAGPAVYTPLGQRHVQLLREYSALMDRLTSSLRADLPHFRPVAGGCSPYGILFGIPSSLIELMALKTLQRHAETRFSLEDVFADGVFDDPETRAAKLAWVDAWRKLPHIAPEVQRQYDYPHQFAQDIYDRIDREFSEVSRATGRLYIVSAHDPVTASAPAIPELPPRYIYSSDRQLVAAGNAVPCDEGQLLRERQEAHFLVSFKTSGGWLALSKDLLSEVLGAGRDARLTGLPPEAAQVLRLMCPGLV